MNRMLLFCILILLPFGFLIHAKGEDFTVLNRGRAVFENSQCEVTESCSLKRAQYLTEDYKVGTDTGYSYGTRLFAWYETDSLETLEDYAFVQFIKGCMYSTKIIDGIVVTRYDVSRPYFDDSIVFKHLQWMIDTIDMNPIFHSSYPTQRFSYKWNKVPDSIKTEMREFYDHKRSSHPKLYITDNPGTAFFMNDIAKNISLKFLLCIYKTKDVPITTTPDNTKFAEPLYCFIWESSFIYDHEKGKYGWSNEIVPACQE